MAHANKYKEDVIEVFNTVKSDGFEYDPAGEHGTTIDEWNVPEEFVRDVTGSDDFALAVRMLLKQKGCNPQLAFFKNPSEVGELVCLVGIYVLSIQNSFPVKIRALTEHDGYTFVALCGKEPGDNWVGVDRAVSSSGISRPKVGSYT